MFNPQQYWETRLNKDYSVTGVGDITFSKSYNNYLYKVREVAFKRAIRHFNLKDDSRILDLGSGTGFYLDILQLLGFKNVFGADITEIATKNLQSKFPEYTIRQMDIVQMPEDFLGGYFDLVSCMDVLFHITDNANYSRAIRNIYNILKPGGYFIFSDNLLKKESRLEHFVGRTEHAILGEMERNGFTVEKIIPVSVLMNRPMRSGPIAKRWYNLVMRFNKTERSGKITGSVLYPLEVLLTRLSRRGLGTELVICKKG